MSDLLHARLRALHAQFLDAARTFPFLYFAAVTPHNADPNWPLTPYPPDGWQLGLEHGNWHEVLGKRNPPLPFPLSNSSWLKVCDRLWEAVLYDNRTAHDFRSTRYSTVEAESDALRTEFAHAEAAVIEFKRLARQCAGNLDLKRDVLLELINQGVKTDDPADAWLEALLAMPFVELGGPENGMLVRRLPVDVFSASARALELIDKKTPSAVRRLIELALVERDLLMNAVDDDRRSPEQQHKIDTWESEGGWFPPGKTTELLSEFQPRMGYSKFDQLYQEAVAEVMQTSAANYCLPKLEAVKSAHEKMLEDARRCYEHRCGTESLRSHTEHCNALNGLMALMPGIEAALEPRTRGDLALNGRPSTETASAPQQAESTVQRTPAGDSPKHRTGKSARNPPERRSWTQADLDAAIREYKAARAVEYRKLVEGVRRKLPGAIASARRMFGRNVVVRALSVKSPAMVSKSVAWRQIADELGLCERRARGRVTTKKVGLEIGVEVRSVKTSSSQLDQLVHQETLDQIDLFLPPDAAADARDKLSRGEMTDEQARELVNLCRDQKSDDRNRKVRSQP
jgi:hypothetical protein